MGLDETVSAVGAVSAGFVIGAQVAGRYRKVRALGAGGMGEVFEVEDLAGGPRARSHRSTPGSPTQRSRCPATDG